MEKIDKVLICDSVDNLLIDGLKENNMEIQYMPQITPEQLKEIIPEFHIIVVRSRTKVTEDVLERASNLKIIARAGIGTDNIDLDAAESRGIQIVTAAGSSTQSVAELNIGLMISLSRKMIRQSDNTRKNVWIKETGTELYGKTVGFIGFGRIGQSTARITAAMGMKILAYDIFQDMEKMEKLGGEYTELDDLVKNSDVIFILASFSRGYASMIGKELLLMAKKGAMVIDTSRAEFIDGKSLLASLQSGHISGFGTDVYWHEPPKEEWEKELLKLDNVVVMPHIGAQTREAQQRVAQFTLNNLMEKIEAMQECY